MPKLTEKQKRFVQEYLVDLNATQAAIRAGYSEKSAARIAVELLNKSQVSAELQRAMKDREKRVEITQDMVLQELANIAFSNGSDFAEVIGGSVVVKNTKEIATERRQAIASIKETKDGIEVKTYDKVRALELVGRHLGMFDGKPKETGQNAVESFLKATKPSREDLEALYDGED